MMQEKPRLVLLPGPPGVGKTAVARALFGRHPNSAWLDDLVKRLDA